MSNIIEITDFNAPELDVYARISEIQLLNRQSLRRESLSRRARKLLSGRWIPDVSRFLFWWNINILREKQRS